MPTYQKLLGPMLWNILTRATLLVLSAFLALPGTKEGLLYHDTFNISLIRFQAKSFYLLTLG